MTTNNSIITNLSGHFLIATEQLAGTYFENALLYVCTHEGDMTLALVVNQEMIEVGFEQVLDTLADELDFREEDVIHWPTLLAGGPVDTDRGLVLHSSDYKAPQSIELTEKVYLTSTADIVRDIAKGKGPKHYNFCMGYSGWSPTQLEEEIVKGDWLVAPASTQILFETAIEKRYSAAMSSIGLSFSNYSGFSGEA